MLDWRACFLIFYYWRNVFYGSIDFALFLSYFIIEYFDRLMGHGPQYIFAFPNFAWLTPIRGHSLIRPFNLLGDVFPQFPSIIENLCRICDSNSESYPETYPDQFYLATTALADKRNRNLPGLLTFGFLINRGYFLKEESRGEGGEGRSLASLLWWPFGQVKSTARYWRHRDLYYLPFGITDLYKTELLTYSIHLTWSKKRLAKS